MSAAFVAAVVACAGAAVIAYYCGEHRGYKRGRTDGDHLIAVERIQSRWQLCDRRYNRAHVRKAHV